MEMLEIIGVVFWSVVAVGLFGAIRSHLKSLKSIAESLKKISEQKDEKK